MQDRKAARAQEYLNTLCSVQPNRRTGSPGNREATDYVASILSPWGYTMDTSPFECLDFESGEASLTIVNEVIALRVSPFTLPCDVRGKLVVASTIDELEACTCDGKVLLMRGELCSEQLMPKNFVFYNPDRHKHIYSLLEAKQPAAIVTATGENPDLVGAMYPFPLFEDGDFDIPSAYCTDIVGKRIAEHANSKCKLAIQASRIPATASNVIAKKNVDAARKVVVTAHIDAYGTGPGASDDAAGVVAQILLAEALRTYDGALGIEIVSFNGEDYYSAGGQMDYLRRYGSEMNRIAAAINIDDVGYIRGRTAYSFYECLDHILMQTAEAFASFAGLVEGPPWFQGDHMVFVQNKVPAMALTSELMPELMASITHTDKDTPDIVDCSKLVEIASALEALILRL